MTKVQSAPDAYEQAGVSIDRGNALVEAIKPAVKSTARKGLMGGLGGFAGLFDLKACGFKDPLLVSGTDGVGTKLKIAHETSMHDTIGQDLVAMCVNDILVQGAKPLFFLDYFACGTLDVDVAARVIKGIAEACNKIDCVLIGGETAEMPGMYQNGEYDLAGFAVGAVERDRLITGETIKEGDVVIGLESNGLHSNGFSLVRHVMAQNGLRYDQQAEFTNMTYGEAFMPPTHLYGPAIAPLLDTQKIKGMVHITGGGLLENIPRVLPKDLGVRIDGTAWHRPALFDWLAKKGGIDGRSMARTFNCGIGFVIICSAEDADDISRKSHGIIIGSVEKEDGERIVIDQWPE